MSVLIHDMGMPKSCNACMFDVYGLCLINKNIEGKDELTHSCPLVPVPPHGDLIDRDPFIEFIKTHWDSYDQWFVEQLEARPVIIPAEEGE